MTILDAGRVAAKQSRAAFDFPLTQVLRFSEFSNPMAYHHALRLQLHEPPTQEHTVFRQGNGAIESPNHAPKFVADIWFSRTKGDFVARLSYLPLNSYWRVIPFGSYTVWVVKQLASTQDLLGYSLLAHPLSKRFWKLSAWKDEDAQRAFGQHPPHVRVMTAIAPHMDKTQFMQWMVNGSQPHLQWYNALRRSEAGDSQPTGGEVMRDDIPLVELLLSQYKDAATDRIPLASLRCNYPSELL